jgi:hypothetical protein
MKEENKWTRVIYIIGIVALIIGAIDPMEGSVVIAVGSAMIAFSTYLVKDRHRMIFIFSFFLILVGIFFLFYLSSLGGFGGDSDLSWWWGILILPYPIGWFASVIVLITRIFNKPKIEDKL